VARPAGDVIISARYVAGGERESLLGGGEAEPQMAPPSFASLHHAPAAEQNQVLTADDGVAAGRMLEDHPNRAFTKFWGVLAGSCHGLHPLSERALRQTRTIQRAGNGAIIVKRSRRPSATLTRAFFPRARLCCARTDEQHPHSRSSADRFHPERCATLIPWLCLSHSTPAESTRR
jgi:hypothetical protein